MTMDHRQDSADKQGSFVELPPVAPRVRSLLLDALLCLASCVLLFLSVTFAEAHTKGSRNDQPEAESRQTTGKRPLIIVPGILNIELLNKYSGEKVWPAARRSSKDDIDLPINGDPLSTTDELVPGKAIESFRFLFFTSRVSILGGLLRSLRAPGGYREGNWETPGPDGDQDTFYTFTYDWRRDNVQVAQEFYRRLDSLKKKLNRPDLRFNILGVSMGGLIARYTAMYGDADLPSDGTPPALTWAGAAHINEIYMLGVPNEGSAEAFAALLDGYSASDGPKKKISFVQKLFFHKLSRSDGLTGMAVFQLMPHGQTLQFLDNDLKPIRIDIYDPADWKRLGWFPSNDADFRSQFFPADRKSVELDAIHERLLDRHLAIILRRTKLFHQALDAPVSQAAPISLVAFLSDCKQTLNAIVVFSDKKRGWVTLTSPSDLEGSDGRKISRREVIGAMYADGDGRVTAASALGDNLAGARKSYYLTMLPIVDGVYACADHLELANDMLIQKNMLKRLSRKSISVVQNTGEANEK
jgi:pimeloyl-ACP methyl ester carboxylesterase